MRNVNLMLICLCMMQKHIFVIISKTLHFRANKTGISSPFTKSQSLVYPANSFAQYHNILKWIFPTGHFVLGMAKTGCFNLAIFVS